MIRVIGCGNPDAGDDAVGAVAIREVRDRLWSVPRVEVVEAGSPLDAVPLLADAEAVVLVDAIRTRGGARSSGELLRLEAGADGLPVDVRGSLSSHGVGIAEAVAVARALGSRASIVVLGVEAGRSGPGEGLSPEVTAAVPALIELVIAEALAFAHAA